MKKNTDTNPNTKSTKEINMKKNTDTNPNTKSTKEINMKKNTDTNPNTNPNTKSTKEINMKKNTDTKSKSTKEINMKKNTDTKSNSNSTKEKNMANTNNNMTEVSTDNNIEVTTVTSKELIISQAAAMAIDKVLNTESEESKSNEIDSVSLLAKKSNEQEQNTNPTAQIMGNEVMRLYRLVEDNEKSTIIDKIIFGDYLLKTKLVHKNDFYTVIGEEINKMKVGRSIKLVLKDPTKYAEGMSTKSKDSKVIEENLKLLVVDERITSLKSVDDIKNLKELTVSYLEKMKELEDEDFKKVLNGDEEPFKALAKKKKEKADEEKEQVKEKEKANQIAEEKRIQELKPKGMTDSDYKLYLDKGIYPVINVVQILLEDNSNLNSENESMKLELEKLKLELTQYKSNDNLSNTSNSEMKVA